MSEEKTVYQWRLKLPKNVRHRYIENIKNEQLGTTPLNTKESSLIKALTRSFRWFATPEGRAFWENIVHMARDGRLTPDSKIEIPDDE